MDLIHFLGLNCYHGCIVNGANFLGVDYRPSFSALWSETDFSYDLTFHMYLTKRMPIYLSTRGVILKKLSCASFTEVQDSFTGIAEGSWFTAGMDAFHMPWNEYYQILNGYHYFLAKKEQNGMLCCFDPTYNKKDIQIEAQLIIPHLFDIVSIEKCNPTPLRTSVTQEAYALIKVMDDFPEKLLSQIRDCTGDNRKNAQRLAQYTDALYINRCIYSHYIHHCTEKCEPLIKLFNNTFIDQWTTVKNGLYKASLIQENKIILEEVCVKLTEIFETELAAAKMVLTLQSDIQYNR